MRGTGRVLRGVVFVAAALGVSATALAGTFDALTFFPDDLKPVTALSNPVTYSKPAGTKTPALETYIGFDVGDTALNRLLVNDSGNTINSIKVIFSASVTDPKEMLSLYQPDFYLPKECAYDSTPANPKTVTCNIKQLKANQTFPAFRVFFVAPQKVCQPLGDSPCGGVDDAPGTDWVSTKIEVLYAEGANGPTNVEPNSTTSRPQANLVSLGTDNPTNIKSAVPKNGAKVFTGNAGVPVPETAYTPNSQFAELLTVPTLTLTSPYTVAELTVGGVKDTEASSDGATCLNGGRFKTCPNFTTSVAVSDIETIFSSSDPLKFFYRIDASNLKLSGPKILSSVQIKYTDGDGNVYPVGVCVNGSVTGTGVPCILSSKCYKKNDTGGIADLEGDCEWVLINTKNGRIQFF